MLKHIRGKISERRLQKETHHLLKEPVSFQTNQLVFSVALSEDRLIHLEGNWFFQKEVMILFEGALL